MTTPFIVVRDRVTGIPVLIPLSTIPVEIRPDNWFENPDWRFRGDRRVLEPLLLRYLEKDELEEYEVRFVAQYIVDYACHIAVAGYIFSPDKSGYEFNVEFIRMLRALRDKARTREDISEMVDVAMEYALDPL